METQANQFERKITKLKEARLQLLKLHKLLVDLERANYERSSGQITSGQFLNLLLNDANFAWLRKFSTLIVEIDEMLDLDDGYTENMIEKQFSQLSDLLNLNIDDEEFKTKYQNMLQTNSDVISRHSELKKLISDE